MTYKFIRIGKARIAMGCKSIFHLQSRENIIKSHKNGRKLWETTYGVWIVMISSEILFSEIFDLTDAYNERDSYNYNANVMKKFPASNFMAAVAIVINYKTFF